LKNALSLNNSTNSAVKGQRSLQSLWTSVVVKTTCGSDIRALYGHRHIYVGQARFAKCTLGIKTKNSANFAVENVKTHRSCKNNISWGYNRKCLDM